MSNLLAEIEADYKKKQLVKVRSGDSVRVHKKIKEGNKERIQVFEGLVIRVDRKNSLTHRITVRKVTAGVAVEKSYMMHSPLVITVEITKRAKVRRNYISYIRNLTGKSARLKPLQFDKKAVNELPEDAQETKLTETASKQAAEEAKAASGQDDKTQPDGKSQPDKNEDEPEPVSSDGQTDSLKEDRSKEDKAATSQETDKQSDQPTEAEADSKG